MVKNFLKNLSAKLIGSRMWIQTAFLLLWLDPLGIRMHTVCSPVLHCYACPLSTFACPIGIIAQFSALHLFPFAAIGLLITFGVLFGTMICGWVCPFGLLQDLAAQIPTPKFHLPGYTGYFRYAVLFVSVLTIPYFFGHDSALFICRFCPTGAIEKRVPDMVSQVIAGQEIIWPDVVKFTALVLFLLAIFFIKRPWCSIFCPLGAIFSLFNRFSAFFVRFEPQKCSECKKCHKLCGYGIKPEKNQNALNCTRCLECTNCMTGALKLETVFNREKDKRSN